jgi:hypothetical protein
MLREIFTFLGFQFDEGGFKRAVAGTETLKQKSQENANSFNALSAGLSGFLGVLGGAGLVTFTSHVVDQAFEIGKLSAQLGMSTHDMQAWELGAKKVGVTASDLSIAFRRASMALAGGAGGGESKAAGKIFARLGIDAKDANGKTKELGDALPLIAEKIAGMKNETEKVAVSMQLFGKSGERLLPILNQGAAGVAKLREEYDKLGGGFSDESIKRAQEFKQNTAELSVAWDGFKSLFLVSVLPVLSRTVELMTQGAVAFRKWAEETTGVTHLVEALAGVLAVTLAQSLAPYLGTGLKFAAIFLAFDDLMAFLEGKDSLIGSLLNHAFGDGTATQVRQWVNDARDSFSGWLEGFKAVVPDIYAAFALQFAKVGQSWDEMILSFEHGWNDFVSSLHLPDGLKFGDQALFGRKGSIEQDKQAVASAQARKDQTAQGVANFNARTTELSGQGAAAPIGPVRAPIVTQNFVEIKPNISLTLPPGVSQQHRERLVREAAAGAIEPHYRAAGQALGQKGGKI